MDWRESMSIEEQTAAEAAEQAVTNGPDAERAARLLAEAAAEAPQVVDSRPQTTYPNVAIDLLDPAQCPPGQRIMVIQNQQDILLFPMPIEYAQALGKKLSAPSVSLASPADVQAAKQHARAMGLPR
jgi:hypothetical protein